MKSMGLAILAIAMLVGCSSEPSKPAQPEKPKPADLALGRTGFQKAYISARGWARDAQPFHLESQLNGDSKGHDGRSAIWKAGFASPERRAVKPFIWSGTDANDAPSRGVNPGTEDTYSPNNASTQVFDMAFLKVDSDKAFEVAQKHGGDKILAKDPDTPVIYILDWTHITNELIWHVIYGTSKDDAKLKIAINGTTGEFLRVEK